ncbi:MAG: hypothetical protein ACK4SX_06695 [Alcanivoracaceae bacterium]
MASFIAQVRIISVITLAVLLSACGVLRERAPAPLASLLDRQVPPDQVAGLDYGQIAELGVEGSCVPLAEAWAEGRALPRRDIDEWMLPQCEADVVEALAREKESARVEYLIEEAWLALEQRRERERRVEQRRRLALELQRRQLLKEQELAQQQASREARRQALLQRLAAAAIHDALATVEVADRPLAYSLGQVSERSLANFLACIELAYPNKGYELTRDGRRLVVIAQQAALPRGRLPIEARFTEHDEFWLLTFLKVAEISAANAQDRFILAQNLLAQSCYGEDGLL